MGKGITVILVMLVIVAFAWIGMGVYFISNEIKIDPNALTYIKFISPSFREEAVSSVTKRVEESLPVSPSEYIRLNEEQD